MRSGRFEGKRNPKSPFAPRRKRNVGNSLPLPSDFKSRWRLWQHSRIGRESIENGPDSGAIPARWDSSLGRTAGMAFGIFTQLLFLWTVGKLFWFLRDGSSATVNPFGIWVDLSLAIGFAIPHSLLLAPAVQQRLKRNIPSGLLGCLHCSVTCWSLLVLMQFWAPIQPSVWQFTGPSRAMILAGFYGSWIALLYSISLTGFGYQTGLTQWWYWLTREPAPRREFVVRGAYRWLRHPVYMSFLGLVWFTPTMSMDHVILTAVWTTYIYVGSYFKDQRLLRFIGAEYRAYATRVSGLPIIGFGPLKKLRA